MKQELTTDAEELRAAFEAQAKDSYGFKRSRKGNYVNAPVARDWKWFKAGVEHATAVDYKARYEALRQLIVGDRNAQYQDKVIHPCEAPSYQNWSVDLWFPDPLPENYDRHDLERPRLTLSQAVDSHVDACVEHAKRGGST